MEERKEIYYALNSIIYSLHHMNAHNEWEDHVKVTDNEEEILEWLSDDNNVYIMLETFYSIIDHYPAVMDVGGKQFRIE